MKIIDRYILKKILSTFFFVVIILMSIITVIDITEKMDKFAKNNLSGEAVLGYYLDFIPWVAGLITPITVPSLSVAERTTTLGSSGTSRAARRRSSAPGMANCVAPSPATK